MIQKNLTNILLALLAVGVVLTAYNAFLNGDTDSDATTKLGNYLSVDSTKLAAEGAEDIVVGTGNQVSDTTSTDSVVTDSSQEDTTVSPDTTTPEPSDSTSTATESPVLPATVSDKTETIYTVKEGDTYGCIAEKYYGSFEHFVDIMASNPVDQMGFGERTLFVDAQLVLPAIAGSDLKPTSALCQ